MIRRILAKRRFRAAINEAARLLDAGSPHQVEDALVRALGFGQQAFGDASHELAFVHFALASRALERGALERASEHASALERIAEASAADGRSIEPDAVKIAALSAAVAERTGAPYGELEAKLARWAQLAEQAADPAEAGNAENQLGLSLGRRGERALAREHFDRALAHRRRAAGEQALVVLETLYNRATFRDEALPLETVASDLERLVRELEGRASERERELCESALHNLAVLCEERAQTDEARTLFDRALALREQRVGKEHPSLRPTLVRLGQLAHREGHLVFALSYYERAHAIARAELGERHPVVIALEAWRSELTEGVGPAALKRN